MDNFFIRKSSKEEPLKIAVLCCDDPNNFYLIHQLQQHFKIVGLIIETSNNQMNWLKMKKRYKLWLYRFYHGKRRRLSGDSAFRKQFFSAELDFENMDFPIEYPLNINDKSNATFLKKMKPDLTVCCGTMYIGKRLTAASNCLINLHGGILPEYKGNQCTFFALYEKNYDKVGMTMHLVSAKLDGGDMIAQVKPEVLPTDNDEMLYCKTFKLCVEKLLSIIKRFENGEKIILIKQEESDKKTFSHCDRTPLVEMKWFFDRWKQQKAIR